MIIGGPSNELLSTKTFTLYAIKESMLAAGGKLGTCGGIEG
jgi:hypothetical protein